MKLMTLIAAGACALTLAGCSETSRRGSGYGYERSSTVVISGDRGYRDRDRGYRDRDRGDRRREVIRDRRQAEVRQERREDRRDDRRDAREDRREDRQDDRRDNRRY